MPRFLAIYTGAVDGSNAARWNALSEAERQDREQRGMAAWMQWGSVHAAAIVFNGGPLGKTKRVTAQGIADIRNAMTGYTVVEAESHEAAANMFENHPHFAIFPGDGVEVMVELPIPGGA
jgi:hypothetical protein